MNAEWDTILAALFVIAMGIYAAAFSRQHSERNAAFNKKWFGMHIGPRSIEFSRIAFVLGGIAFVIFGLLLLVGIIDLDR